MIRKNFFITNFLKNYATVMLLQNSKNIIFLNGYYLSNKKFCKTGFNTKKINSTIIVPNEGDLLSWYNYNHSVVGQPLKTNFKKLLFRFPLRWKIKWYFRKFKYHGKGFKVKKFNKLSKVTFRLGKSHWTKIIFNQTILKIKRTKKNTYCAISIRSNLFRNFYSLMKKIKGINRYTKRGLRLTRQFLKKRFGKVSQASSVYK